jgi:non-ribosomal peptide synthetase component E (peptide arylation enzyme)
MIASHPTFYCSLAGPAEIENCLLKHPSVAMAAVIGVPDQLRGEIVKVFIYHIKIISSFLWKIIS